MTTLVSAPSASNYSLSLRWRRERGRVEQELVSALGYMTDGG